MLFIQITGDAETFTEAALPSMADLQDSGVNPSIGDSSFVARYEVCGLDFF
jgi:hypothetical protein